MARTFNQGFGSMFNTAGWASMPAPNGNPGVVPPPSQGLPTPVGSPIPATPANVGPLAGGTPPGGVAAPTSGIMGRLKVSPAEFLSMMMKYRQP